MILYRSLLLLLVCVLGTAGCMVPSPAENLSGGTPLTDVPSSVARYQVTLAQPGDTARMIKMDTDVYNAGEVVEFVVTNEENRDLSCAGDPPSFSILYQKGSGQWVTRMEAEKAAPGATTTLKPGESTAPYRFVTAGWSPNRYRIVSGCGVSREILVRSMPPVTAGTLCPPPGNTSPSIQVNPVSDQYAGEKITISGTTNLPADEELRYSVFSIGSANRTAAAAKMVSGTTLVTAGSCGSNSWSVNGVIEVPGEYGIGISNAANTVSAVKRFIILPHESPMVSATPPAKTPAPGIAAG